MMRKLPYLLSAGLLALAVTACEGPAGPAGQAGEQGPPGPAGQNALNTCSDCHDSDATLLAIEHQMESSVHGQSDTYVRTGSCSRCHNHQGFLAYVEDGTEALSPGNPLPINCYTCHQVHETYTGDDFALTATEPVEFIYPAGATADFNDGNLCATCHMAREPGFIPTPGGAPAAISGSRFGTHYGTQSNTVAGEGYFTYGAAGAEGNPHMATGCNTCHMAGDEHGAGFHTWNVIEEGCLGCHDEAPATTLQTNVDALMDELHTLLIAEGILADADAHYASEGTYDQDVIAAFLNYFMLSEDGSSGIHNPFFVEDLLTNTVDMMRARQAP